MKITKIFILSIFFIASGHFAAAQSSPSPDPPSMTVQGCWLVEPIVKICESSHVKESRVIRALEYWERLGYKFKLIIFNDNSPSCLGEPGLGEIIIRTPDESFNPDYMAVTRRTVTTEERFILYSVIHVKDSEVNTERTLEHEIGHAIGWNHASARYHIMYEEWRYGGWTSTNVSHRAYSKKCEGIIP